MGAQRNQEVESRSLLSQDVDQQAKEHWNRSVPSVVRYEHDDPAFVDTHIAECGYEDIAHLFLGEAAVQLGAPFHHTPLNALNPPSTGSTIPVTKRALGLQSQMRAPMSSSASPNRPRGVCAMTARPRAEGLPSGSKSKLRFMVL